MGKSIESKFYSIQQCKQWTRFFLKIFLEFNNFISPNRAMHLLRQHCIIFIGIRSILSIMIVMVHCGNIIDWRKPGNNDILFWKMPACISTPMPILQLHWVNNIGFNSNFFYLMYSFVRSIFLAWISSTGESINVGYTAKIFGSTGTTSATKRPRINISIGGQCRWTAIHVWNCTKRSEISIYLALCRIRIRS